MTLIEIRKVRTESDREVVRTMVWAFVDFLRARYPEMQKEIDAYVANQDIPGQLADFETHFTPPHGECFLALADDAPVGIVMIRPIGGGICDLNRMYVDPQARGLGVGRTLCAAAVAEARALGYTRVQLSALHRHVEALPLYQSLGFERYFPDGGHDAGNERVHHMRLDLTSPDDISRPDLTQPDLTCPPQT